jgi:DivIVA domain-containing protein
MPLTAEDVKNRQFSSTRFGRGYDEKEVDDFLDEVEAEITKLTRENADLRTRLQLAEQAARQAPQAPQAPLGDVSAPAPAATFAMPAAAPIISAPVPVAQPAPPPPPVVEAPTVPVAPAAAVSTAAVEPANEQALRMLTMAQRTADETVNEARRDADKLLQKARQEADQLERETKEQHRSVVGNLESERERLERKIDELRSFEREYRARLKSYLEGQLRDLDGSAAGNAAQVGRSAGIGIAPPVAPSALGVGAAGSGSASAGLGSGGALGSVGNGAPTMNGPAYAGAQPGRPPAPLFAPVSAPPVPGTPLGTPNGLGSDPSPAGPPRQAPSGGYEIEDGPEVPPTHS